MRIEPTPDLVHRLGYVELLQDLLHSHRIALSDFALYDSWTDSRDQTVFAERDRAEEPSAQRLTVERGLAPVKQSPAAVQ
jgi:hypothetical protein